MPQPKIEIAGVWEDGKTYKARVRDNLRLQVEDHISEVNAIATTESVTVGTSTTAVLGLNVDRRSSIIVNDSDTVIYLSLQNSAVANKGIRLNPEGGTFTSNTWIGVVNAIHAGTGYKNLTVTECSVN
tara:strand:+ start:8513 stop:8896 length:384 start_codon:yes stop_codon:yes gene_type:complete